MNYDNGSNGRDTFNSRQDLIRWVSGQLESMDESCYLLTEGELNAIATEKIRIMLSDWDWRYGDDLPELFELPDVYELVEYEEEEAQKALESSCFDEDMVKSVMKYQEWGFVETLEWLDEGNYWGEHDTLEKWAISYLEETGEIKTIPEEYRIFFDYRAWATREKYDGNIFTIETPNNTLYVFNGG